MSELILPEGWIKTEISSLGEIVTGKTPKKSEAENYDGNVPFIKPSDLNGRAYIKSTEDCISEIGLSKVTTLPENTIMVTCIGNLGKVGITTRECATNQQINSVIPHKLINYKFLYYNALLWQQWLEEQSSATTISIVNKSKFSKAPVLLSGYYEQKEIVKLLDTYLTTVSQIQARLDAIPKLLEKFRQSVLNDAVSGKLTEKWRRSNKVSALKNYEDLLQSEDVKDKTIKELKKLRAKSQSQNVVDERGWIELPFFELAYLNRGFDLPRAQRVQGDFPIMSSSGLIDHHNEKKVEGPCVVVGRSGSVGKVFFSESGCWPLNTTLYVKSFGFSNPKYVYWALKNMNLENYASSTAVPSLNRNVFMFEPVYIPPLQEQKEIVELIEMLFSHADQIEKNVAAAKARVDNLTQSILHQAFTGKLTEEWRKQNPELITGDNSAEALLAKIEAEKKESKAKKKK